MKPVNFVTACAAALATAAVFYPLLRLKLAVRLFMLIWISAVVLLTPFTIAGDARLLRCLASVLAVTMVVKLYDLHLGAARGHRPGFASFLAFLLSIFSLVHRNLDAVPRRTVWQDLCALARALALFAPAALAFKASFSVDWHRYGFAAEHTTKVVLFFLALVPFTAAVGAAWRLAGGRGLEFMNNPFAARTPADFWRRYNRPVHQFLLEDVFAPLSGRRFPLRGTAAVFVASAAIHEYVFSVAIGRLQGYQTVFFLLQGLAVALTLRLKPRGLAAAASVAATFLFNVATGVLFFASVDSVVPFYENRVPLWETAAGHQSCPAPDPPFQSVHGSSPGARWNGGRSNSRSSATAAAPAAPLRPAPAARLVPVPAVRGRCRGGLNFAARRPEQQLTYSGDGWPPGFRPG